VTLTEVVLKYSYDHPFCDISRRFPYLKIVVWCNEEHDIIEITGENQEECSAAVEELSKISEAVDMLSDEHKIQLTKGSVAANWRNGGAVVLDHLILYFSPIVYEQGWEYCRVIAFRHEDIRRFLQRLEERVFVIEILRKVPFDGFIAGSLTLTADALFSDLTEKQMDALMSAHSNGYYRLPRKLPLTMIAKKKRILRTAFEEHLRKAENKIVTGLIPYLQLFTRTPAKKRENLQIIYEMPANKHPKK